MGSSVSEGVAEDMKCFEKGGEARKMGDTAVSIACDVGL